MIPQNTASSDGGQDRSARVTLMAAIDACQPILKDEIRRAASAIPAFKAILGAIPEPSLEEEERAQRRMKAALVDDQWGPYAKELRDNGRRYAKLGVRLRDWFALLEPYRLVVIPHVVAAHDQQGTDLAAVVLELDRFLDRAMLELSESYLAEREELAKAAQQHSQRLSAQRDLFHIMFQEAPTPRRLYRVTDDDCVVVEDNAAMSELAQRLDVSSIPNLQESLHDPGLTLPLSWTALVENQDGSVTPVFTRLHPATPGYLCLDLYDMTDFRSSAVELREKAADLARSNQELEQFAYVASHDLQEPLRMVASYTELLAKRYQGQLDDDADSFIRHAVDGAKRMKALINDLLAYSRTNSRPVRVDQVDLNIVLDEVLESLSLSIRDRRATVVRDDLPAVLADRSGVAMVFSNLVSNALKFCESDPVVHIRAVPSGGGVVRVAVEDNGIGIEEGQSDRIFRMFQRLHSRVSYPGNGVGLAIVRRVVERNGGAIDYRSEPGRGTTFVVTLPEGRSS